VRPRLRPLVIAACVVAAACAYPATASAGVPSQSALAASCAGLPKHTAIPVVDAANVIKPEALAYLAADLMLFHLNGHEAVVAATVPELGGDDVASYARRLFDCWGVGDKDSDNGVLILVAMRERRVRIELGAGLQDRIGEEQLDLALETMTAPLRGGDVGAALRAGAAAVVRDLGEELPDTKDKAKPGSGGVVTPVAPGQGDSVDDVPDVPGVDAAPEPDSDPFGSPGGSPGSGLALVVPLLMVAWFVTIPLRMLFRGGVGGSPSGGSTWRGGFPRYGSWGGGTMYHGGGWHDSGHSGSSGFSGSGSSGSSGGGGSFGGGSGGGGGASGSW
jgi:uncharacterized protein